MSVNEFKILTLNIHKGFSMGLRQFTLESIRNCLRETNATVVFLQEVVGEHARHARNIPNWPGDQLEYLADSVWTHHAYGKNAIYLNGHHGNAILSEMPFSSWDNLDISLVNFSQRGILHGITAENIHLICVHLGLFEAERRIQTRKLLDYVKKSIPSDVPLIVAGDFNDWRKRSHQLITRELQVEDAFQSQHNHVAKTFPAFHPMLAMDRIYLRGFKLESCVIMNNSQWRKISDHCALLATVKLAG